MSIDARFDDPRLTTVGLLFETTQGLSEAFGQALAKNGLSLSEFEVLLRLARTPQQQLRMSDLAAQTTLSTSGITRVVDRLERHALVKRVSCPSDRRGYHATLTEPGARKLAELLPEHVGLIDELVMSRLGDADVHTFTDALRKVRDAVRPTAVQGAEGVGAAS
jgi:MarR family transcriptional regulator, 2-MHQ and catechol-resistance regulon repressor